MKTLYMALSLVLAGWGCGDAADAPTDVVPSDVADATALPDSLTTADTADASPADTAPADTAPTVPPGDDCAHPRLLGDPDGDKHYDALGDVGEISGLGDRFDGGLCGVTDTTINGAGQADEVWRFVAPAAGEYAVSVLSDTGIDVVFYVLDGAKCLSCLGFDDSASFGDIDHLALTLAANDVVAIVVDGKANAHAGTYIVDVFDCQGTCP